MPVKIENSGRRSIHVEVEVPGSPEECWKAIATGPGVSAWFFPTDIDEREGGAVVCHTGPGMEATANITSWDPPRRFTADAGDLGSDAPRLVSEWTVEPRSDDSCVVRVEHSVLAKIDEWDDFLESFELGWPGFFGVLRLYLAHHRGRPSASILAMGSTAGSELAIWNRLTSALGIEGAEAGEHCMATATGVPAFGGTLKRARPGHPASALVLLDAPAPGIASLCAFTVGEQVQLGIRLYFYGENAKTTAAREELLWQAWLAERFPSP